MSNAAPQPCELTSNRLLYAPVRVCDASVLFDMMQHEEGADGLSFLTWPMTMEQAEGWVNKALTVQGAGTGVLYIARDKETRQAIGMICLISAFDPSWAEIGYWTSKPYQGQGFATEMIDRMITYGFNDKGLSKLHATVSDGHVQSIYMLEKVGFVRDSIQDIHGPNGDVEEGILYILNKNQAQS